MSEIAYADRLVILARHDITSANRARYECSADSRVQGLSPDMPLDELEGGLRSHAFGIALGRFVSLHNIKIIEVHSSRTVRTETTRDLALEHMPGLTVVEPTSELWEHRKGVVDLGGLEGMLRTEAYPDEVREQAETDPDFRHGTLASGGETPNEAGRRWLDRWFRPLLEQANFQPRTSSKMPIPTVVAFGHNLVTAMALEQLYLGDREGPFPPVSHRRFRVDNANGLLLFEKDGRWSVSSERLLPTRAEYEKARTYRGTID